MTQFNFKKEDTFPKGVDVNGALTVLDTLGVVQDHSGSLSVYNSSLEEVMGGTFTDMRRDLLRALLGTMLERRYNLGGAQIVYFPRKRNISIYLV